MHDLVAADGLYRANGINTDLEIALFLADHDRTIEDAVSQARTVYEAQPGSIRAADALSWALYKAGNLQAGNLDEALTYSNEALRLGTQDPLLFFHAGMINIRLGNDEVAADHLARALKSTPTSRCCMRAKPRRRWKR
jgi:tetratricopeptide (TPR) repeat protein